MAGQGSTTTTNNIHVRQTICLIFTYGSTISYRYIGTGTSRYDTISTINFASFVFTSMSMYLLSSYMYRYGRRYMYSRTGSSDSGYTKFRMYLNL